MFKKKSVQIIIVLTAIFLLTILTIHLSMMLVFGSEAPKLDIDGLKECYNQNEEVFDAAALVLSSVSGPITIYKNPSKTVTDDKYNYYKTEDGYYIESTNELSKEVIERIGNSLTPIFKKLKFSKIYIGSDKVIYFIEGAGIRTISGLVYVPTDGKLDNMYIIKSQKITENWYAVVSE